MNRMPFICRAQGRCGSAPVGQSRNTAWGGAFTLVELLVVLAIIALLAGLSLPVSKYVARRLKQEREKTERLEIAGALDQYRATFGEYPIPGDPAHYPTDYVADPNNELPTNYYRADLTQGGESITMYKTTGERDTATVDYRLTWPLMLGPQSRGEPPFIVFPEEVVRYVVYKTPSVSTQAETRKISQSDTTEKTVTTYALEGTPITRVVARSPYGSQWEYQSDGATYSLRAETNTYTQGQ